MSMKYVSLSPALHMSRFPQRVEQYGALVMMMYLIFLCRGFSQEEGGVETETRGGGWFAVVVSQA